ncbi:MULTISPECIES: flavodoxin family protein [Latilactobacillus]|uniref:Uncharacterized protein lasN n=1 Tax=Latilactobacillus sakei TaxID=1599 RepID=Q48850_LATSK|nr:MULTISPECIES: flavodoxin family protein [Latilactobacillus]ASN13551.1 hypothetical protein B4V05_09960 [Latilactobacillus sakei]MCM1636298.1 flavodoxin family protein [Latilactobacillus sakei]MCW8780667.1 flavodoxin family protein [Latilactobacillus curvatus]USF99099.1 hypothetical protein A4W81_09665 [Latilactobacillus sakei]UTB73245.1 hypothetical protein A4W72_10830 [Latilactobacillus curvatus]
MKIFAFSGAHHIGGLTNTIIERLVSGLKSGNDSLFFRNPTELSIKYVESTEMFTSGIDTINDDIQMIRDEIASSDVIILGTPVYIRHISGSMKTFLDRLGAWTHTYGLAGKRAIVFAVSSSTGEDTACEYLSYVSQQMGLAVDSELLINTSYQTTEDIFDQVDFSIDKLKRHIADKEYIITDMQRKKFALSQTQLRNNQLFPHEIDVLSEKKLLEFGDFDAFFRHMDNINREQSHYGDD